jgi:hypothetical protein
MSMKKLKHIRWNYNSAKRLLSFVSVSALTVLLCVCASNPVSSLGPLVIPQDIAGIVHAGHTNTPEEYALLEKLGVIRILRTFNWSDIEPVQGQWNFDSYDRYVDTAGEAGKKVLGILAYDVKWIHPDRKEHKYIPPDKIDLFLEYVRQTVTHFQGRVDAWCIWNEPNFQFWTGSRDEFLVLARRAADAVREADSEVTLLGGAFNRGIFSLPKAYIRGLFESGAMEKTDAVAFHPYELNPVRTLKLYRKFRALVAPYGFTERIWITEVGYPTGGWYPTKTTEKKFPAYVVKTFVNLAVNGAKNILWYQLFDPINRKKSNSEDFFGLVRSTDDYTSKGAEAFRLCALYIAGTTYRPDLPRRKGLSNSLRAFYFEQPAGGKTLVLWKEGVPAKLRLQAPDDAMIHDPITGNTAAIPAEKFITVGSMPVFISWQDGEVLPFSP